MKFYLGKCMPDPSRKQIKTDHSHMVPSTTLQSSLAEFSARREPSKTGGRTGLMSQSALWWDFGLGSIDLLLKHIPYGLTE